MTLPERANFSLTESDLSPFPVEPAHQIACQFPINAAGYRKLGNLTSPIKALNWRRNFLYLHSVPPFVCWAPNEKGD